MCPTYHDTVSSTPPTQTHLPAYAPVFLVNIVRNALSNIPLLLIMSTIMSNSQHPHLPFNFILSGRQSRGVIGCMFGPCHVLVDPSCMIHEERQDDEKYFLYKCVFIFLAPVTSK